MNAKKNRKWKMAAIAVLVLTAYLFGRMGAGSHDHDHGHDQGDEGAEAGAAQEYTCSMHPQIRSTDPNDRCPLCGMELIPVPKDEDDQDDGDIPRLRLGARAMALMDVQTWPAERRAVEQPLRLLGRVDVDETRVADVVARTDGYIERLHTQYPWQAVRSGDRIADVYSPAVVTAFRELKAASDHPGTRDAVQSRLIRMGVAQEQIDEVLLTGEIPATFWMASPADGAVQILGARSGEAVSDGQRLVRVVDLSTVWMQLEAYEADLPLLREGQAVELIVAALPDRTFTGEVTFIDPVVNDSRRTVRLRVEVENDDALLKPGMFASAVVAAEYLAESDPLIIPASAPLITGRRALVYVRVPDTERPTFESRQVTLGPRVGDHYVVLEGLHEGDLVVVNGQFKIDSELQIRGRPSMMQPGEQEPSQEDPVEEEMERKEIDDAFAADIGRVIDVNFELVEALAGDDPDTARSIAEQGALRIRDLGRDELSSLADKLEHLAHMADIAEQRRQFEVFSDRLTEIVRRYGTGTAAPVFRAMCPMVEGRRGYWLQPDVTINNPYHGAAMLRCGEIVEQVSDHD